MHATPSLARSRDVSAETSALVPVTSPTSGTADLRDTHVLGEAIASLAAGLHAATYQLLVLLREFDARNGWNNGFLSCAHWLHWRTGFDLGASREKVRVARALPALPRITWAMERGQLSYAKVRALTRVATQVWVDDDGMVVVRGRLTPEAGAVVMRAVDAAAGSPVPRSPRRAFGADADGTGDAGTTPSRRAGPAG